MDRDRRASRDRDQFLCNAWMRYPSFFHADDRPTIFRRLLLECLRGKSPPTENAGQ